MSIEVKNISKLYGTQKALDNVSFSVNEGQILGFLGPNGAGKSTLMKMITCYIPPTEGDILVYGMSIHHQENEIKKIVGYLPEHNPLYLDMYVKEYLSFIGGIHKIKALKNRVQEIIQLVGLELEQHKKIGALSKGYRQRVGLAQAMIHDPKVLILDEPTTGLDPNQIIEIRNLIKTISKNKTVMHSTHIMQEVEAICDKVVIINRGNIVANDETKNLISKIDTPENILIIEFDGEINTDIFISEISELKQVTKLSEKNYAFKYHKTENDIRKKVSLIASKNDMLILSMKLQEQSLEDVFKQLTKKN